MRSAWTLALAAFATLAHGQPTEWRTAFLDCGGAQVRALAECYTATRFCISETLTFVRRERRTVVGLHKHYDPQDIDKLKVPVLNYTAFEWACLRGASGGHYVSVTLARTDAGSCSECEFHQLYDLNGRLVASRLAFDKRGRPRENPEAAGSMRQLTGRPDPKAYAAIYRGR